jgi:hypothetical protein
MLPKRKWKTLACFWVTSRKDLRQSGDKPVLLTNFNGLTSLLFIIGRMTLEQFKIELIKTNSIEEKIRFLRRYIFHGLPFVFESREHEYFEFRQTIAEKFEVGFQEVFIVGSAKLGFSYIKGTEFSYDSDIDVVIVNERLFEQYYLHICEYQYSLDKFRNTPTTRDLSMYHKFLQYLVKGWMRPDLLPISFQETLKSEWFDFFQGISNGKSTVGNYKVSCGLFKNYNYLEKYHLNGITQFHNSITTN